MEAATANSRVPIAVIGAGPAGLAMALGLARHGVRSVLLEQKSTTSRASKAPGLHVRTREVLRQWGVEERFLDTGELLQPITVYSVVAGRSPLASFDFSELAVEADHPGLLIVEQSETERLLLEAVRESGMCQVRFDCEAMGLEQDDDSARVTYRDAGVRHTLEAAYVVGCDGASSFVRDALGLSFEGMTYSLRPMLADVRIADERDDLPQPRAWTGSGGYAFAARLRPGLWRLVHLAQDEPAQEEVTGEEVDERVNQLLGPGPYDYVWGSRFRIHVRASPRFRVGRVFLAGDAAHVHSPVSGFGMNGGIQDAHNLAWKLAYALDSRDANALLESYEVERREVVVETTSQYTDRVTRLFIQAPAAVRDAAWFALRALLGFDSVRLAALRRTAMIDLAYSSSSPLLQRGDRAAGARLPNPLLRAPDGRAVRLYELIGSMPVLIDVAEVRDFATDLPLDSIPIGSGGYEEPAGLLRDLLGRADGWILVRPDAHVAWARRQRAGLEAAVLRSLGRVGR